MLAEAQVFENNSIYVYFLSCIVIFSYQHFTKRQKISLIYATTIAMELISKYSWTLTLVMLLISMFILEEYLSDDKVKCELLGNVWYKMIDFTYQFIFIDAGIGIVINIIVSDERLCGFLREIPIDGFYGVNIGILLITIHMLNTSKFGLYDFQTIKRHFDQFDGKKIMWDSQELQRRFDIMVGLEDKSYFDRENSYNWFSVEFLKYKIETYRENRAWKKHFKAKRSWRYNLKCIWRLIKRFRLIRYVINRFVEKFSESKWSIDYFFRRLKMKIRGCSTLEMQLIRNIGIEKGYDKCIIRRKMFEFVYTYIFFNGLRDYYENTQNSKRREFKKFILYVYLHSIRLNMFGNDFKTIDLDLKWNVIENCRGLRNQNVTYKNKTVVISESSKDVIQVYGSQELFSKLVENEECDYCRYEINKSKLGDMIEIEDVIGIGIDYLDKYICHATGSYNGFRMQVIKKLLDKLKITSVQISYDNATNMWASIIKQKEKLEKEFNACAQNGIICFEEEYKPMIADMKTYNNVLIFKERKSCVDIKFIKILKKKLMNENCIAKYLVLK